METQKYTVLRIRKETRQLLRRIAATYDESMVQTIDRLARQEWTRIQKGELSRASEQEDQT